MEKFKKIKIGIIAIVLLVVCSFTTGCSLDDYDSKNDTEQTIDVGSKLSNNQQTPTDIDYSLERYNLIKRAYWVNGMRDKANSVSAPFENMPLGYIVLFTESGSVVNKFVVDGKVTSLNSFLTPDSEYYEKYSCSGDGGITCKNNKWVPDVDGSYGENDNGIFFFTTDGKYVEWTGTYLYSDIPFEVKDPVVKIGE